MSNKIKKIYLAVLVLLALCPFVLAEQARAEDPVNIVSPKEICDNVADDDGDKLVDAGDPDCYTLLAPLPGLGTINTAQGLPPYIRTIFRLAIGIAGVIAVIIIVWAGIEYMMSDIVFKKEDAKSRIWSALGGLVLLIGSVVILNTINPDLLNLGFKLTNVSVQVSEDDPSPVTNTGKVCVGRGPGGEGYTVGADWATASGLPIATLPAGVAVNKGECAKVGDKNCTSLRGLPTTLLTTIKSKCPNCELTVTGGTECWAHKTHGPNVSAIDLRSAGTPNLNKYITGSEVFPNDGKAYTKDGVRFLAEMAGQTANTTATHWHISPAR